MTCFKSVILWVLAGKQLYLRPDIRCKGIWCTGSFGIGKDRFYGFPEFIRLFLFDMDKRDCGSCRFLSVYPERRKYNSLDHLRNKKENGGIQLTR